MVHENKLASFSLSMRSDVLWNMCVHGHGHKRRPETYLLRSHTSYVRL